MYSTHVPIIAHAARANYKVFERAFMFAVLSARQPFNTVPDQLAGLERDGEASPHLFSWKLSAYQYIRAHGKAVWRALDTETDAKRALYLITRAPGMGLVKGAFVLQLIGFDIACLDSQNTKREGRNPREFETRGQSPTNEKRKQWPSFLRLLDRYVTVTGGQAEHYWNAWCEAVGPKYGMSGEDCSRIHLAIVPRELRSRLSECRPVPYWPLRVNVNEIPF